MFTEEYFSKWFDIIPEHDARILWDDGTYTTTTPTLANDLKSIIDDYDNRINNMNSQLQQATKDASSSI